MANVTSVQTLLDGPRNWVVKVDGVLDTSDLANTTLVDPAVLSANLPGQNPYTQLRIDCIDYDVEDALELRLLWDANTPVKIWELTGRGTIEAAKYGGLINNAGAGKSGKILYATQGWAAGLTLSFTALVKGIKQ